MTPIAVAAVGGCALLNPLVDWTDPASNTAPTIQSSIVYAEKGIAAYTAAAGDQQLLTATAGIGLIPLAAAAAGLGIAGGHANTVLGLGLAGTAGYATISWLASKPRTAAYLAGQRALVCAKDAIAPFRVDESQWAEFRRGLLGTGDGQQRQTLNDLVLAAEFKAIELEKAIGQAGGSASQNELVKAAVSSLAAVNAAVATAKPMWDSASALNIKVAAAGNELKNAVDRIKGLVNKAVNDTLPDINTLPKVLAELQQFAQTAVPKSETPKPAEPKPIAASSSGKATANQLRESLTAASTAADQARIRLEHAVAAVRPLVVRFANVKPAKEALALCNVDAVATDLSIVPTGPVKFTAGKTGSQTFVLSNGKGPFFAQILEGSAPGISVAPPFTMGTMFTLSWTDKAKDGTYTLFVGDAAGHSKIVQVIVEKSTPPVAGAAAPDSNATNPAPKAGNDKNKGSAGQ